MLISRTALVKCLILAMLFTLAGCDRSGDGNPTPTASIGVEENATPGPGADQGPSLQKPASDPLHPVIVIETSLGNITLRLDAEKAPQTVNNFLYYVAQGHYDQTMVHQVYKGQGFLAGGYGTNGLERPSRTPIRNEAHNGLKNHRGTIAMVRSPDAIHSATCQFIVNVADNPVLDYKDRTPEGYGYCVFGEVTEGMDVVDRIAGAAVHDTTEFECTPAEMIVVKTIQQIR